MLRDRLIPSIWCCDSHRYISYLTLICIYRNLPCYTYYLISDTGTCHAILIIWYLILVLAMLYLLLDTWHRYLPWYTYYLISDTGTCHAIFDPWYLTPVLAMLYLTRDTWHWYLPCYTWHLDAGTCHAILDTWYITPVLDMLYLTPDTWHLYYLACSWLLRDQTSGTPVLLNSCISCTPVPCTATLVNSTVRPASGRACLVSRWRGCIPQLY